MFDDNRAFDARTRSDDDARLTPLAAMGPSARLLDDQVALDDCLVKLDITRNRLDTAVDLRAIAK